MNKPLILATYLTYPLLTPIPTHEETATLTKHEHDIRFVKAEEWRAKLTFADGKTPIAPDGKNINLEEEIANWDKDGSLKKNVAPYYPQYYHKTDKVHT